MEFVVLPFFIKPSTNFARIMESTHKFNMESTHKFNMESTHKFISHRLSIL